jgi:Cu(I)/Ag(I) efflux system protein CusF
MKRVIIALSMCMATVAAAPVTAGMEHEHETGMESGAMSESPSGTIMGTGVIKQIDKTNGKIKMTHDPIETLGWPRMTMSFRVKDAALLNQVKEGDQVTFELEKGAGGYTVTKLQSAR